MITNKQKDRSGIGIFVRIITCIIFLCLLVYSYIDKQNDVTERRLEIPTISREIRELEGATSKLHYEVERFESPVHLIELSRKPEFGHLKNLYLEDILQLPEGNALQ